MPANAVWAGGPDGGVFIVCRFDESAKLNHCTVYNDYSGQLEQSGYFTIKGNSRADQVNQFKFNGADGRRIYLLDGSVLSPVEK